MNVIQLVRPEDQDEVQKAFQDLIAAGSGAVNNALVLRQDGKQVPVDITTSLVK